jgi:hypothetical protein
MTREEWLLQLGPGVTVAIVDRGDPSIHIVHKRTPSGRLVVASDHSGVREFNADGYERGNPRARLEPVTESMCEHIEYQRCIAKLKRISWDRLSLTTLRAVIAALEAE